MDEKLKFAIILAGFLAFFLLPADPAWANDPWLGGIWLLSDYSKAHVLGCLVPAFFIAGGITVFLKKEFVLKYLSGKEHKALAYGVASVSGAILAVCSCTVLPLFAGIYKRGAGLGPATTFLFSGPAINVAAISLTMGVLGYELGIARIVSAIAIAIIVGIAMDLLFREKTKGRLIVEKAKRELPIGVMLAFFGLMIAVLVVNGMQIDPISKWGAMSLFSLGVAVLAIGKFNTAQRSEWLSETWSFTKMLTPYLFAGVFIAGAVQPLLPQATIESLVGSNTVQANLVASIFGAFMYFATLTEIPIMQALMAKGMGSGPALALLLAGPSLSLPSMLVINKVLGMKKTVAYILLVILLSTTAGTLYGWFTAPSTPSSLQNGFIGATPTAAHSPTLAPTADATPTPAETPSSTPTSTPTATPEQTPAPFAPPTADDIISLGVSTDKESYHTGEEMSVTVAVNSTRQIEGIEIWIYGMQNSRQMMYLNRKYPVTLQEGENEFTSKFIVPSCSSCSGISYGVHSFDAIVLYNGTALKSANATMEIAPN